MKLGIRAQAELRTSLSKKILLYLLRVLVILSLSLSVCWKMVANESHNVDVKIKLLRRCSIVSSWASKSWHLEAPAYPSS